MELSSATTIIKCCANCGKGEDEDINLKACVACKLVKYCNRDCQIAHRPQHKKACKKRAAELHDEKLFEDPPPPDDCPICFLPLPDTNQRAFRPCCGKNICDGCDCTVIFEDMGKGKKKEDIGLCPFCRTPTVSGEETVERITKLMEKGNAEAHNQFAGFYADGRFGLPQDAAKANELYLKAGELGCAEAYYNLANHYYYGDGVDVDKKKAKHFYERAVMGGDVGARHNLGIMEGLAGNTKRAMKHLLIAAKSGFIDSLEKVKEGFKAGMVTKDEYAQALRAYHERQLEMKSEGRDKAVEYLERTGRRW